MGVLPIRRMEVELLSLIKQLFFLADGIGMVTMQLLEIGLPNRQHYRKVQHKDQD